MLNRFAIGCAIAAALLTHARAAWCHGAEMFLGSTAPGSGALALSYDFSDPTLLTYLTGAGGLTLYQSLFPGIEWIHDDQPADSLYALPTGTPFSMRIVSIVPPYGTYGAQVILEGTPLTAAGQSAFAANTTGTEGDHVHPQWQLVLPDGVTGTYTVTFELTTTSPAFTTSARYSIVLTNATETPTPTLGTADTPTPTSTATPSELATTATPTETFTPTAPDASPTDTPPPPAPTSTPTPTETASATPTPSDTPEATSTTTPGSAGCPGDCNDDTAVTVDELVTCVTVGLGMLPVDVCPPLDADADGRAGIEELVGAVNAAINGCASAAVGSRP